MNPVLHRELQRREPPLRELRHMFMLGTRAEKVEARAEEYREHLRSLFHPPPPDPVVGALYRFLSVMKAWPGVDLSKVIDSSG